MQYLHLRSVFPTEHHPKTDTMKRLLLLLFLPFALGACDDGDTSRIETWTVAPEKGVAGIGMGFGHVPAYIVKRDAGSDWEIGPVRIGGFTFERGYETRMRVRIEQIANPPADGPSVRCTMVQQIEHTPASTAVDPESLSPEYDILIASEQAASDPTAYWFKDERYDSSEWVLFPWEIVGFNFCPGYEAHIRIRPVAVYGPTKGDYRVQYRQVTLRSTELKDSEGLPTL